MDKSEFISKLSTAFERNGLGKLLSVQKSEQFFALTERLLEENEKYNLTAITDPDMIILNHYVDCAALAAKLPKGARIIDVGCGAGFPSLPIAILRDDVMITPLDSTAKKIGFIKSTAEKLDLRNITPIASRAEEYALKSRESFGVAISRAVARLNILDELCIPFVKVGGRFIAMKSSKGEEEYTEAQNGIIKLGCALKQKESFDFSFESIEITREIYVFEKKSQTPKQYPRNYSQICKKPL